MVKESFYFPHDFNAIQDPKMMTLLSECGLMGVGMYWIIIEVLHQQATGKITHAEFKRYLTFYFKCDTTKGTATIDNIEHVLNTCGLLVVKDGFVYSDRVLKNKQYRDDIHKKRSFAGKRSAEARQVLTDANHKLKKRQATDGGPEFDKLWAAYPSGHAIGKKKAIESYSASVKTDKDKLDIWTALNNYKSSKKVLEGNYVQNGSTWFNNWRDWVAINTTVDHDGAPEQWKTKSLPRK